MGSGGGWAGDGILRDYPIGAATYKTNRKGRGPIPTYLEGAPSLPGKESQRGHLWRGGPPSPAWSKRSGTPALLGKRLAFPPSGADGIPTEQGWQRRGKQVAAAAHRRYNGGPWRKKGKNTDPRRTQGLKPKNAKGSPPSRAAERRPTCHHRGRKHRPASTGMCRSRCTSRPRRGCCRPSSGVNTGQQLREEHHGIGDKNSTWSQASAKQRLGTSQQRMLWRALCRQEANQLQSDRKSGCRTGLTGVRHCRLGLKESSTWARAFVWHREWKRLRPWWNPSHTQTPFHEQHAALWSILKMCLLHREGSTQHLSHPATFAFLRALWGLPATMVADAAGREGGTTREPYPGSSGRRLPGAPARFFGPPPAFRFGCVDRAGRGGSTRSKVPAVFSLWGARDQRLQSRPRQQLASP